MVGELSEDGKWIWDGSDWKPVQAEESSKPLSAPSTNKKKTRPITIIVRIFTVLLVLAVSTVIVTNELHGVSVNAIAYQINEADFEWVELFPLPLLVFTLVSYTIKWKTDPIRISDKADRIAHKADIEFASGNITDALNLYKKIGDLEKVKECSELLASQQPIVQDTTPQIQDTHPISSNLVLPSVQDSVVSGDIHYHINTSPNDPNTKTNVTESNWRNPNWRPAGFVENADTESKPFKELSFKERFWALRFEFVKLIFVTLGSIVVAKVVVEIFFGLL